MCGLSSRIYPTFTHTFWVTPHNSSVSGVTDIVPIFSTFCKYCRRTWAFLARKHPIPHTVCVIFIACPYHPHSTQPFHFLTPPFHTKIFSSMLLHILAELRDHSMTCPSYPISIRGKKRKNIKNHIDQYFFINSESTSECNLAPFKNEVLFSFYPGSHVLLASSQRCWSCAEMWDVLYWRSCLLWTKCLLCFPQGIMNRELTISM